MATTSIWSVKGWLGKVVIYVENPAKTDNPKYFEAQNMTDKETQGLSDVIDYAVNTKKTKAAGETHEVMRRYVSGVNCSPSTARDEMMAVKMRYGKDEGVIAYHGYQSFAPGEADPDMAHKIGIQLAEKLWGERFQVIVATHLDKENHLHNHFVVNTVSYADGLRYHRTEKDYYAMQKESDKLCREYGLSVIENPKRGKSKQYGEWRADQEGKPTWRSLIKRDVDEAAAQAMTDKQFFFFLRKQGYEIKMGKDISVKPPGKERFFRLARNFGEDYTLEGICRRILARTSRPKPPAQPIPQKQPTTIFHFKGDLKKTKRIGGLRGLYLHYCYKLGILPKGRPSPARLHFLLREDLRKLDAITKETRLLCVNHIDTLEQLLSFQEGLVSEIETLTGDRKRLRNQSRSMKDELRLSEIKADISVISGQLSRLRREVKSCSNIAARSVEIKEKLNRVRQDGISNGREDKRHEQFRGRS